MVKFFSKKTRNDSSNFKNTEINIQLITHRKSDDKQNVVTQPQNNMLKNNYAGISREKTLCNILVFIQMVIITPKLMKHSFSAIVMTFFNIFANRYLKLNELK